MRVYIYVRNFPQTRGEIITRKGTFMVPDFPLIEFQHWLIRVREVSIRTSATYISLIRSFFGDLETAKEWISEPKVLLWRVQGHDSCLTYNSRGPFRAAMRAFLAYTNEVHGTHLGIVFSDERRAKWRRQLEEERKIYAPLAPLLRKLEKYGPPFDRIPLLRWRDVRGGAEEGDVSIEYPTERRSYSASTKVIREIGLWAGGGEKPEKTQPLIPIRPKDFIPMRKAKLISIARGE